MKGERFKCRLGIHEWNYVGEYHRYCDYCNRIEDYMQCYDERKPSWHTEDLKREWVDKMFDRSGVKEEYYKCKYEYIKEENNKLLVENTHLKYKMSSYDCQEAEIKKLKEKNSKLVKENGFKEIEKANLMFKKRNLKAEIKRIRENKKEHLRDMRINGFKNYCPNCGNRGQLYYDEDDNIICVHCLQTYLKSNGAGISGCKNLEMPGC
jgi:ribosomal protein S27E